MRISAVAERRYCLSHIQKLLADGKGCGWYTHLSVHPCALLGCFAERPCLSPPQRIDADNQASTGMSRAPNILERKVSTWSNLSRSSFTVKLDSQRTPFVRYGSSIIHYSVIMTILSVLLLLLAASTQVSTIRFAYGSNNNRTCSRHELGVLSCSPESLNANTCCTESPGGLLLLTQLYNWNPGLGPSDSWTIHGLWPNFCNGSYPASCDKSREYIGIAETLKEQKQWSLLQYMQESWRVCGNFTTTH